MSRVALGFKPRTGRAELVVLAEDGEVLERAEVPLLPAGEWNQKGSALFVFKNTIHADPFHSLSFK